MDRCLGACAGRRGEICYECLTVLGGMCRAKCRLPRLTALRRAQVYGQDAYACEVCGFWHTGNVYAGTAARTAAAKAILDRVRVDQRAYLLVALGEEWGPDRVGPRRVREMA
jgi:hypothetical protein